MKDEIQKIFAEAAEKVQAITGMETHEVKFIWDRQQRGPRIVEVPFAVTVTMNGEVKR